MKAITVKYIPTSPTKPSRLKAFDCDANSLTISWDSASTDRTREQAYLHAAQELCRKMNWPTNLLGGGIDNGYVFVFANTPIR